MLTIIRIANDNAAYLILPENVRRPKAASATESSAANITIASK